MLSSTNSGERNKSDHYLYRLDNNSIMNAVELNNGMSIPAIIFGPDEIGYTPHPQKNNNKCQHIFSRLKRKTIDEYKYTQAVANAIHVGFHSIDFSAAYGDGRLIAKSIKKSGIDRKDILITTRVSNRAQYKGVQAIEKEFFDQLRGFNTEYMDILMFHWPVTGHFEDTWKTMIRLQEQGYCRMLGVANCHEHHIERLYNISGIYPLVNQVEVHPLFTQISLRKYCREHGIQVEAYSPTGRQDDRLLNPPFLNMLSRKYHKSVTQIILRWHIQNGIIPVIRSLNHAHQKSDIDIFDFEITDENMKEIDALNINSRLRYDPDNCDFTAL